MEDLQVHAIDVDLEEVDASYSIRYEVLRYHDGTRFGHQLGIGPEVCFRLLVVGQSSATEHVDGVGNAETRPRISSPGVARTALSTERVRLVKSGVGGDVGHSSQGLCLAQPLDFRDVRVKAEGS